MPRLIYFDGTLWDLPVFKLYAVMQKGDLTITVEEENKLCGSMQVIIFNMDGPILNGMLGSIWKRSELQRGGGGDKVGVRGMGILNNPK